VIELGIEGLGQQRQNVRGDTQDGKSA
jgi:hypothetical protein